MKCFECKANYYAEDIASIEGRFQVKDPDTGKTYGTGFLCSDHVDALLTDGYELQQA